MSLPALHRTTLALVLAATACAPAHAATYDLKEKTPAVQHALDGRKARYDQLRQLKSQGVVGESNQGLVQQLAEAAQVDAVLEAENRDRRTIYEAIVEQNQLGAQGLEAVQAAFAEVQREKAQPGDRIQLPSGEWTAK